MIKLDVWVVLSGRASLTNSAPTVPLVEEQRKSVWSDLSNRKKHHLLHCRTAKFKLSIPDYYARSMSVLCGFSNASVWCFHGQLALILSAPPVSYSIQKLFHLDLHCTVLGNLAVRVRFCLKLIKLFHGVVAEIPLTFLLAAPVMTNELPQVPA